MPVFAKSFRSAYAFTAKDKRYSREVPNAGTPAHIRRRRTATLRSTASRGGRSCSPRGRRARADRWWPSHI